MKKLFLSLFVLVGVAHAALTTVADVLYDAGGNRANGIIQISWPTFTAADGHVVQASATPLNVTISNGVLSIALEPNDTGTPTGSYYTVTYYLGASIAPEIWVVPTSGSPVNLATVRTVTIPATVVSIPLSQIQNSGVATGNCIVSSGSAWIASTGVCLQAASALTSGSILYWNGSALAQNNTFLNWNNTTRLLTTSSGIFYDSTASTGSTTLTIRAGPGQSSTNLFEVRNNSNTLLAYADHLGQLISPQFISNTISLGSNSLNMSNGSLVSWSSDATFFGTVDLSLYRNAAGVMEIDNGTPGTYRDIKLRNATFTGLAGGGSRCVLTDNSGVISASACPTASGLTTNAIVTAASSTSLQTPSSTTTLDSSGNIVATSLTTGDGTKNGTILLDGKTSGGVALGVNDVAGTAIAYIFNATNGASNQVLFDNGSITCPTLPSGSPATCHDLKFGSVTPAMLGASAFAAQTDGATVTWAIGSVLNANASLLFTVHSGSRTLNITNPVAGGSYTLKLTQDATGGEGLLLGTGCTWKVATNGMGAITLTNAANAIDLLRFFYDGSNCLATLNTNYN